MRPLALAALAALALGACRTEIAPVVIGPPPEAPTFAAPPAQCEVRDYVDALDVPSGAQDLGWVQVKNQATDADTLSALHQAICAKGGDALSQLSAVTEPGEHQPSALSAHAWKRP